MMIETEIERSARSLGMTVDAAVVHAFSASQLPADELLANLSGCIHVGGFDSQEYVKVLDLAQSLGHLRVTSG